MKQLNDRKWYQSPAGATTLVLAVISDPLVSVLFTDGSELGLDSLCVCGFSEANLTLSPASLPVPTAAGLAAEADCTATSLDAGDGVLAGCCGDGLTRSFDGASRAWPLLCAGLSLRAEVRADADAPRALLRCSRGRCV